MVLAAPIYFLVRLSDDLSTKGE